MAEETAQQRLTRYRTLAVRARESAGKAAQKDVRESLSGLARAWDELADQVETETGPFDFPVLPSGGNLDSLDHVSCEQCGAIATLMRRTPHPARGAQYELQTFACSNCGHTQTRDAEWH